MVYVPGSVVLVPAGVPGRQADISGMTSTAGHTQGVGRQTGWPHDMPSGHVDSVRAISGGQGENEGKTLGRQRIRQLPGWHTLLTLEMPQL